MSEIFRANLLNPIILCFVLGLIARVIRSELALPKDTYHAVSIFLLLAIGMKGGVELAEASLDDVLLPVLATLMLGCITPITSYVIMRRLGKFSVVDSAAVAAHYGSVSAVTYIAAQSFVTSMRSLHPTLPIVEGYLPTLLTLLEAPGIAIALALGAFNGAGPKRPPSEIIHEVLTGRTIVLLVGGLMIGVLMGENNWHSVAPFFDTKGAVFKGALCIFLLELGILAGGRLGDLKKVGPFILGFGIVVPILHGLLAVIVGDLVGISIGGCTVLAAMVSSASYIAAPPAVRMTLPEANPTLYLTSALVITFPFNMLLGIPLYYEMALLMS